MKTARQIDCMDDGKCIRPARFALAAPEGRGLWGLDLSDISSRGVKIPVTGFTGLLTETLTAKHIGLAKACQ